MAVRVPMIASVQRAVEIYLERPYLGNAEIDALFGGVSSAKRVKLKEMAREVMRERDMMCYNETTVNTAAAYEAWGLDIADLESRYRKMRKLGILQETEERV